MHKPHEPHLHRVRKEMCIRDITDTSNQGFKHFYPPQTPKKGMTPVQDHAVDAHVVNAQGPASLSIEAWPRVPGLTCIFGAA